MKKQLPILLAAGFILSVTCEAQEKRDPTAPKGGWVPPTAEELAKVEAAIPNELPAPPGKDRKLLVYSLSHGFKHNSRLIGEEMLRLIEKKTGAFELTINNNASEWTADYLAQFDAIAILNATQVQNGFKNGGTQQAFNVPMDLTREHPTSWCKKAGKGRVFYATFGHNESVYWDPAIVEHYIRGIQYALGDLTVDDSPDGK
jgi:hypothetical protein